MGTKFGTALALTAMRARMLTLRAGLALLLTLPTAAQTAERPARTGPLRYGPAVRSESGGSAPLVCRPLYLRGDAARGGLLLDYVAGKHLPLLEGFVAYRSCRMDTTADPPRPEGLGPWAVLEVAQHHIHYPRFPYFVEARSTPAWERNLVAYWGVFKPRGTLEAVVVDWQHKLIVARKPTELQAPPGRDPLPAPRWDYSYRRRAGWQLTARFEFAGQTLRLPISPHLLR
ncbi:MAG: hypothetical protein ACE5H2_08805 [Terriglobia bacterium]